MLDLIEKALRHEGIKFGRIDGKGSISGRVSAVKALRDDPECRVLLASITSAGEGYVSRLPATETYGMM
jgi:SNF2 family DNA or RNA helicase